MSDFPGTKMKLDHNLLQLLQGKGWGCRRNLSGASSIMIDMRTRLTFCACLFISNPY